MLTLDTWQNMLYKNLHLDYYQPRDPPGIYITHLEHCIDYLRQAIMCTVDITPIPVEWSDQWNRLVVNFDTWHTCRNFDGIKDWMLERNGLKHPLPPVGHPLSEVLGG